MARRFVIGGEVLLALGISALGVFLAIQTAGIEVSPTYARVGPRVFPWVVSFVLIGLGLWLAADVLRAGKPGGEAAARTAEALDWNAFLTIGLGLVLHMALIGRAGFVIASTVLFVCVARAFDSRKLARNAAIGAALSLIVYVGFQYGLGLDLPAGFLAGIL
jgi:putative tricarboxylic transport membrane protein